MSSARGKRLIQGLRVASLTMLAALYAVTAMAHHSAVPEGRVPLRCDYRLDSRQDFESGRVATGERAKTGIVFELDEHDSAIWRAGQRYSAKISPQAVLFRIGAVDYSLDRVSGRFHGTSESETEMAKSVLTIEGSCKPVSVPVP